MIYIIALIVFGVLGIFSASHRIIAKEAFDCVFRRLTLRRCDSGLDKRLKAQITGKLMKGWPRLGRQIYKHFEIISWIFLIMLLVSIFFTAQAGYFFIKYGNCNGEDSNKFCIFDPLNTFGGTNEPEVCSIPGTEPSDQLVLTGDFSNNPSQGNLNSLVTVIEFGCFSCPNTKEAFSTVEKVLENYGDKINFIYVDFPLTNHEFAYESAVAAKCVWLNDQELYWDYHFKLFESENGLSEEFLTNTASELGVNMEQFNNCITGELSKLLVDADYQQGLDSHIYGTPTFFINEDTLVGAISYREFKKVLKDNME